MRKIIILVFCSLFFVPAKAQEGVYKYGRGKVYVIRKDPKEFVMQAGGEKQLIDVVKNAYKKLTVKNSFILERGPYVLASVVDESEAGNEPLRLKGDYINLFSPELDYAGKVSIEPGSQAFLFNLREAYDRKRPHVIASASRIYDEKVSTDKYFRFVAKGPKDTKNIVCILLPEKSAKTIEVGCADSKGNSNLDYEMKLLNVSSDTGVIMRLLWVKTDNDPDGINFTIAWKK